MENYIDTVISQFGNSPTIMQLIESFNEYIDPTTDFDTFFDFVWNVDTAQGFGLDIWGRIVGVGRELTIPGTVTYMGFEEGTGAQPFNQAPFFDGVASTQSYTLADPAYRTLILVKALANISACTARSLNTLLQSLFAGRGRTYVVDTGGMQMRFVFEFALLPYEIAILTQSGVVPRPAAVDARILQLDITSTFGFNEGMGYQTFNNGVFFNQATGLLQAA